MAESRLLFSAMSSGVGKTTVTCSVMQALRQQGLSVAACKCGPDFIDPMFHRAVLQIPSGNLDLYLSSENAVRQVLSTQMRQADLTVLEGVMGFYDGVGMSDKASTWAVADVTQTPVVLIVKPSGAALSLAAQVRGICQFRKPSHVRALLLNSCSPALYARLAPMLTAETGLPVAGYLPPMPENTFQSRHLGLVPPQERAGMCETLDALGRQCAQTVDLALLLRLAHSAPPLDAPELPNPASMTAGVRIAVARDEAFCFYYAENLSMLERSGAQLCPFSPLRDAALPSGCSGLYLGGGWPELFAAPLSKNIAMRTAVQRAVQGGMPTLAECGGYLYLLASLQDEAGSSFSMAGVLPGGSARKGLRRFGYAELVPQKDSFLLARGDSLRVHCFHYWDSDTRGSDCIVTKPDGRMWTCGFSRDTLFASFAHLYFPGKPELARAFVEAADAYGKQCKAGGAKKELTI